MSSFARRPPSSRLCEDGDSYWRPCDVAISLHLVSAGLKVNRAGPAHRDGVAPLHHRLAKAPLLLAYGASKSLVCFMLSR